MWPSHHQPPHLLPLSLSLSLLSLLLPQLTTRFSSPSLVNGRSSSSPFNQSASLISPSFSSSLSFSLSSRDLSLSPPCPCHGAATIELLRPANRPTHLCNGFKARRSGGRQLPSSPIDAVSGGGSCMWEPRLPGDAPLFSSHFDSQAGCQQVTLILLIPMTPSIHDEKCSDFRQAFSCKMAKPSQLIRAKRSLILR